jgi:hypothetical protein
MPRIRSLKPEALQHRKVGRLSDRAFRLWIAMLTQADDEGRFVADPSWLKSVAWSYHPTVTREDVMTALEEIMRERLVVFYSVSDRGPTIQKSWSNHEKRVFFGFFPSWTDHQRIDRPTPSRYPSPQKHSKDTSQKSTSPRRDIVESSTSPRRGSEGSDRKDRKDRKEREELARAREGQTSVGTQSGKSISSLSPDPDPPQDEPAPPETAGVAAVLKVLAESSWVKNGPVPTGPMSLKSVIARQLADHRKDYPNDGKPPPDAA